MGPDVLKDELLAVIGEVKNNTVEGIDNIPEMLKHVGERAIKELV